METNLSFPRYLTQYLGAKVTTGYCDPDEILADTNECLSDTTVIISEFIKVKLRNSFENINYSPFLPGWTKLCNMHQGGVKFKLFSAGSVLQARFSPRRSPGWIQPGQWDRVLYRLHNRLNILSWYIWATIAS